MSMWSAHGGRRAGRDLVIWITAGAFALSVHAGAAALAISPPGDQAVDAAPAPAFMLELAPEPTAVQTEDNQISEDRHDAAEHVPLSPPASPSRQTEPDLLPAPDEILTQSVPSAEPAASQVNQEIEALDKATIPLPIPRPMAQRPTTVPKAIKTPDVTRKNRKHAKQERKPASPASSRAAADVKKGKRTAASLPSDGAARSTASVSTWKARLAAHLERRKKYPSAARARGETGTAYVSFSIDAAGRVVSASLARTSGFDTLDRAALAMVERASPVPAPPPGANRTITAPVRFVRR